MANDDDAPETIEQSRRTFFSWAGSLGLTGLFGSTLSDIVSGQEARGKPEHVPEPYAQSPSTKGNPHSDVYHTHPLELPGMREQVSRAAEENNPNLVLSRRLRNKMRNSPHKRTYSLLVRTVGERNTVTSRGDFEREINGWRATENQVAELEAFGTVGHVPEFSSTTVTLHDVRRSDIRRLATLDFVVDVEYHRLAEQSVDQGAPSTTATSTTTERHSVRNTALRFDDVDDKYTLTGAMKIGVLDSGYGRGLYNESPYPVDYANPMLNETYADLWYDDWELTPLDENHHGDLAADTLAFMLNEGHDDLIVPLTVQLNTDYSNWTDALRGAVEFAELHDISVINMSLGVPAAGDDPGAETFSGCPSEFCDVLSSYTESGYIPVAIAGNHSQEYRVSYPGASWNTIGVGMASAGGCYHGFERTDNGEKGSNYGTIDFRNEYTDTINCAYCHLDSGKYSEFVPDVYGYAPFEGGEGPATGTSTATPEVAAAAAIMQSNTLYDYAQAKDLFQSMHPKSVCPNEAAKRGEMFTAKRAYDLTN